MSTLDTTADALEVGARDRTTNGIAALVTSADHKVIGRMFIGTSGLVLLAVAALGVLLGAERIDGGDALLDSGAIPQMFVAYRVGFVFGVAIPLLLGIALAVVPLQVGARALAFPRLAGAGFWAWVGGLALIIVSLANNGGPGGGDADMVDLYLAAQALMAIGLSAAALTIATTVLTTRAPGMTMRRVPLFAWSALVAAIGLVLLLPVLVGVLIYLFVDHRFAGETMFGGTSAVGSWTAFVLTQPATYLFVLPAIGLFAELVPVAFGRRAPLRGVSYAGLALVGVAALSGVTQQIGHPLPWEGSGFNVDDFGEKFDNLLVFTLFMLVPLLGALIVLGTGLLAARPDRTGPRPQISVPLIASFLGLGMILTGMIGGALGAISDLGLSGTVFEEAALVYVVYGGVLAAIGGVCYWAPVWWGRLVPPGPALGLVALGFLATVLAALPYFIAGFADQPALAIEFDYDGPSELWNVLVTVGHGLMLLVALAFAALVVKVATGGGEPAGDDPWDGQTLEWTTALPAPDENFVETPTVASPEPLLDLRAAPAIGAAEDGS
jgi:cytochrome o ubiquinol oxidase subunit 1